MKSHKQKILALSECSEMNKCSAKKKLKNKRREKILNDTVSHIEGMERIEVLVISQSPPSSGKFVLAKEEHIPSGLYCRLRAIGSKWPFYINEDEFEQEFNEHWIVVDCALCPTKGKKALERCFETRMKLLLSYLDLRYVNKCLIAQPRLGKIDYARKKEETDWLRKEIRKIIPHNRIRIYACSPWVKS